MTQWVAFFGIVALLTVAMIALSILTQRRLRPVADQSTAAEPSRAEDARSDEPVAPDESVSSDETVDDSMARAGAGDRSAPPDDRRDGPAPPDDAVEPVPDRSSGSAVEPADCAGTTDRSDVTTGPSDFEEGAAPVVERPGPGRYPADHRVVAYVGDEPVTTRGLLINVAFTQGLFLAVVVGAILYTGVPIEALGIAGSIGDAVSELWIGLGAGLGLYVVSEGGSHLTRRVGIDHDEWLRESLAPSSRRGWVGLFVGVLPLIALFEELLFRAVLIGAFAAGFAVSPWLLAIASSILFAVGHGIQGTAGIVVTGVIGFALAALFIVTGSLLSVVVAHYVLNACEFAIHEGLDLTWPARPTE